MTEPSDGAREDVELLLNDLLSFAEKMLAEHGGFFPFAGAMKPCGEIVWIGVHDGREHPPPGDIVQMLIGQLRASASKGAYIATALVSDVGLQGAAFEQCDAVLLSLDHRRGFSAELLYPYIIDDGRVRFAEAHRQENRHRVFAP